MRQARAIPELGWRKVLLPPGLSPEAAVARLLRNPLVEVAEPDIEVHATALPNDTYRAAQTVLSIIRANDAWSKGVAGAEGSDTVVIAILDSGIRPTHQDLACKVVAGTSLVPGLSETSDPYGHGTEVAGVAAACTDNTLGVAGVAWRAKLMPVKVLDDSGRGSLFDAADGIMWAFRNGARVINMSFGSCQTGSGCSEGPMVGVEAAAAAWSGGAVLVAAAGNEAMEGLSYPASYANVLGIAATDDNDNLASFSNYGASIDLAAPGISLYTTGSLNDSSYTSASGTSLAAPVVSGLAAVLLGAGRTNEEAVRAMQSTAEQPDGSVGWNKFLGYGRVNMLRALAGPPNPSPVPARKAWSYPNPFSPVVHRYMRVVVKPGAGEAVRVEIASLTGDRVWTWAASAAEVAGMDFYFQSPIRWDGRDEKGRPVAAGAYLMRVTVGTWTTVKKVAVIR
jgi:thermitase